MYKGALPTIDINLEKLQIETITDHEHQFTIDVGEKKYEFIAPTRFMAEQWVEAIECSSRTATENRYSITGKIKNISKIVTHFELDRDALKSELIEAVKEKLIDGIDDEYHDFEEVHVLLALLTEIQDEMIQIFDACLAQKPSREDIIHLFMETQHVEITKRLRHEWEVKALQFEAMEILYILEWTYNYYMTLSKFGIKEGEIENGYLTLCQAYKMKIHLQIHPLIRNVLLAERQIEIETDEDKGFLYTHAPADIFKIFVEAFEMINRKQIPQLTLNVLSALHEIFLTYLKAIFKMITHDQMLSIEYLVALSNNMDTFFDQIQDLLSSVMMEGLTREEVKGSFSERTIQQHFTKIEKRIIQKI